MTRDRTKINKEHKLRDRILAGYESKLLYRFKIIKNYFKEIALSVIFPKQNKELDESDLDIFDRFALGYSKDRLRKRLLDGIGRYNEELLSPYSYIANKTAVLVSSQLNVESIKPNFSKTITDRIDLLARNNVNFQYKRVSKIFDKAYKEKLDYAKLKKNVSIFYDKKYQVERMARTETIAIFNTAKVESFRESGVVSKLIWNTAEDELVCPVCEALDGKVIGISDSFYKAGEVINEITTSFGNEGNPPIHPNCRCSVDVFE